MSSLSNTVSSGTGASREVLIAHLSSLSLLRTWPTTLFTVIAEYARTLKWILMGGLDANGCDVLMLDIAAGNETHSIPSLLCFLTVISIRMYNS
jgi:hypothetical protein